MWVGDLEADGHLEEASVVWCGVFKELETGVIEKFSPLDGENYVKKMLLFLDKCESLCFHNGLGYDWPLLKKLYGYEYKGDKTDTLVLSRLFKPNRTKPQGFPVRAGPHSIEAWGYRVGIGKPEHEDWSQFSEEMLHRCTRDVEILEKTYYALMEERDRAGDWSQGIPLTNKLFEILYEQERYGWLFDKEHGERCLSRLNTKISRIDRVVENYLPMLLVPEESKTKGRFGHVKKPFKKNGEHTKAVEDWAVKADYSHLKESIRGPFSRVSFRRTNLNSDKEIKEFLLAEGWTPLEWNSSKSTGERTSPKLSQRDPFNGVNGKVGKLIVKRIQCRHRLSQIEGWFKRLRPDGRIPARVTGLATTGRAKHSNIVNVPGPDSFFGKEMRQCFTCPDGKVIVGTDSAGCQNRMLAARVDNEFFTKTLLEGSKEAKTSIHFVNMAAIKERTGLDVSYHDAKTINYATLFGGRGKKVGGIIKKGPEVGDEIRKAIFSVAPGFEELVNNLTKEWRSHAKRRRNAWGKIEYYGGWFSGLDGRPIFAEHEHTLLVYLLQSDEAIMMAAAYCFLYKWATKRFGPFGEKWAFLIWYHDEFQAEVDEEIASEFAALAERAIETAGRFYNIKCPHKGESDVGKDWFETH